MQWSLKGKLLTSDEETIVDGWPLLHLQSATGLLRLCLVFLDLPPNALSRRPSSTTRPAGALPRQASPAH
jgi:hypothetical protein